VDERVTVRERGVTDGCPFCRDTLHADDEVWSCGTCETRLHSACFRENGLACTVLGCGGKAVVPVTAAAAPATKEKKPREGKRARKRRLREQHRKERGAARKVDSAWTPATRQVAPQTADDTPWFQGPIGLAAILTLLLVLPPVLLDATAFPVKVLAVVSFCAGIGWIICINSFGQQR
jgi:hypothetical protein